MSYDVFISYARADNKTGIITQFVEAFARKYNALTGQNLQCFFDVEEIKTAQDWELRLLESLSQSRSMIAFLSSDYIKSEYCRLEWSRFDFHSALNLVVDQGIRPLVIMKIEEFESELKKASPEVQRLFNPIQRQAIPLNEFIDSLTDDYIKQRIPTLTSSDNPVLSELDESIRWVQRLSQRREQAENSQRHGSFMAMNRRFVGRTTELRELRKALAECREVAVSAEGIAGIGKSELATAYAHAFAWDYPAGRWFIPCEDQTNLTELLARYMSEGLGINLTPEDRKRPDSGFYRIRYHLNSLPLEKRKVLVVLDNVNKDQLVSNVAMRELGVNADDFDILITSRKRLRSGGKDEYLRTVTLGRLGDNELLNLLGVGISAPTKEREAGLLFIEKTGGLTLAIEIAGVYCRNHSVKISDYVANLQSTLKHLTETSKELDEEGRINDIAHREPFIQQIFRASIETLSPIQQAILCYAACCHPDFVPRSWLQELASNEFPELEIVKLGMLGQSQFDKDLKALLDASLLESPLEGTGNFRIHRLIAETIRQMPLWNHERHENLTSLIKKALKLEWYDQNLLLQPEAIVAWLDTQKTDSWTLTKLRDETAWICMNRGLESLAECQYKKVLESSKKILGAEHLTTLGCLNNMANILQKKGNVLEAERLHRQVVAARARILGPNDSKTLSSQMNLASLLSDKGDLAEAESLFRQVITGRMNLLGAEDPETLTAWDNLANLLLKKGDIVEAEKLCRPVIEARERILGSDHIHTLSSLRRLAILLKLKGDIVEAEQLLRHVLEVRERILGTAIPDTIDSQIDLANLLSMKGDFLEAEVLYKKAVENSNRILGAEHPKSLSYINNLAILHRYKGDLMIAEQLHSQVWETSNRILGPDHQKTLRYLSNLAICLDMKGDLEETEKLYRQVFETRERILGPEHKDTKSTAQAIQKVQESITQVENCKGKMDCPRCQGTGFVTMQDIVRLEMMGELQLGVCPLCSASL